MVLRLVLSESVNQLMVLFTQFRVVRGAIFLGPVLPPRLYGSRPLWSSAYISQATPSCLVLLRQKIPCALALALVRAGNKRLARMAMIARTTSNSTSVKAVRRELWCSPLNN